MTQFTFQATDDDGVVVTVEFETDIWLDAFPKFLQLCKGSGFIVDENTALYAPTASRALFDDRDFLIFDSDFAVCDCDRNANMDEDEPEQPPSGKTLEQLVAECHSDYYYDGFRNK
jgi:hypothetical protein